MKAIQSAIKQASDEEAFPLIRLAGLMALVLLAVFLLTAPVACTRDAGLRASQRRRTPHVRDRDSLQ